LTQEKALGERQTSKILGEVGKVRSGAYDDSGDGGASIEDII